MWSSEVDLGSISIALGDVDGDGDLDLASGGGSGGRLFENAGDSFALNPSWLSISGSYTYSVALGDVDRDGYLDLVVGNVHGSNTLHENVAGSLPTTPTWLSGQANNTQDVALGDIDGNGYLDLVCGNSGQANTLYENVNGSLATDPIWSSGSANYTQSVALGDVNGDGKLDLVCGNGGPTYFQSNTLYFNLGDSLSTTPSWSSGPANHTNSVALGDVDSDGDLDLVCGNSQDHNTLYENVGGSLSDYPIWESEEENSTYSVAWGDIDGDGDLDLACGNGGNNKVYENLGGYLSTTPSWSSVMVEATSSVVLSDVDCDGDLDLVCGNLSNNSLYENLGGGLSTAPSWSSGPDNGTYSVALGDLDNDGDLDLVCGNSGSSESNTLYDGLRAPVFKNWATSLGNHLPNNGAHLHFVQFETPEVIYAGPSPNYRLIRFDAFDVESDDIYIVPQFQFEGEPIWRDVELQDGSSRVGPLTLSPEGVQGSVVWDVERLPDDDRNVILRLLVSEIPGCVSTIQHVAPYLKHLGPITPSRPLLTIDEPPPLQFGITTVGDTTSVSIELENRGSELLTVSNVAFPSPEVSLTPPPPFSIPPYSASELVVSLQPRTQLEASGEMVVHSDDPLNPATILAVEAEILPLAFTAELLPQQEIIPLGETATFLIRPATDVHIEGGAVHYRAAGSGDPFSTIDMRNLGAEFMAAIPGAWK